ncbi:type I polyketide synthase [Tengunoibacter tsumagoiensis]|uniref:Putative polyketide synthase n=1 Tax=Tengunoibacter tsumagoiensis TaxID=2014871 RepID=A0A402A363_9CHLR|nr:type I polyketide synthase [Tengunoibacter tsumagoiensis]GCE13512.1 putative polyketide synthase [Tengunoibacter tsumagoiensis]
MTEYTNTEHNASRSDIAIIGMSGRFPDAPDLDQFWQNIRDGIESIRDLTDADLLASGVSPTVFHKANYVRRRAVLDNTDLFAANFFGYTPREAAMTDPQQRFFLECAWHALEDAGYDPERMTGLVGVYGGSSMNTYLWQAAQDPEVAASIGTLSSDMGNAPDFLSLRVSYKLNLRGPSVVVQSACSTSLVAVHMACQSLLNGECDMALAGGVSIQFPQAGYPYREGGIAAPDGHCRAFDSAAQGTVPGSGVGIVVLKRLTDAVADRDSIRAVIKGSAMNNDGARKVGFTAPSSEGQAAVIAESQALADIEPDSISYIEAHGTGTPVGDPIEVQALTHAFRSGGSVAKGFCALGSLKTNIGHLDAAAGIAGLIKTVLSLQHRQLPPSLHFVQPNPACQLETGPFYVNTQLRPWSVDRSSSVRRAGVSAFGIGGTNAHVILEESPALPPRPSSQPASQLLLLSAKSATELEQMTTNLMSHLVARPDQELADIAATLQLGRRELAHRRFLVAQNRQQLFEGGERWISGEQHRQNQGVVFLFPGQGNLSVGLSAGLYRTELIFRQTVDTCADLLRPYLKLDIRTLLYPEPGQEQQAEASLQETAFAQPVQFVLSYALAQLWQSWGIQPQAMLGHSLGEYVAACLAGVFTCEEALQIIAYRGALMQKMPIGSMISVALSEEAVRARLVPGVEIAALNGAELTVVTGPRELVSAWQEQLSADGITYRPLRVTRAFHSALLDPIIPEFVAALRGIALRAPQIPYLSNVSGTWITASQATDPAYWGAQLRQPVQFIQGLHVLQSLPSGAWLEVGPGASLSGLARRYQQTAKQDQTFTVVASMPHPKDRRSEDLVLLEAVGHLWLAGVLLNWDALVDPHWRKVPLPTYPFERSSFWYGPKGHPSAEPPESLPEPASTPSPQLVERAEDLASSRISVIEEIIIATWSELIGALQIERETDFFLLGGDSLVASLVIARFTEILDVEVPLRFIFEHPIVSELAIAIEELLSEEGKD